MPIGRDKEPTGNHVVLDLNEYEASIVCGALAKYGHDMTRNIALVAAMDSVEKAEKMKDILTPELDRVHNMLSNIIDNETYTSSTFDIDEVKRVRAEFEEQMAQIEYILTDGEKGTCPPGTVVEAPAGVKGDADGKVVSMNAFKKKKLH